MPATYEPIATTTVAAATSLITFNSIPSTYTDLRIIVTGCSNTGSTGSFYVYFNNDFPSTVYSYTRLGGNGSTASTQSVVNTYQLDYGFLGQNPNLAFTDINIFSYAGSKFKTSIAMQSSDQNGSGFVQNFVGLWRNTAAITRIDLDATGSNFRIGSTATLYGIKAA